MTHDPLTEPRPKGEPPFYLKELDPEYIEHWWRLVQRLQREAQRPVPLDSETTAEHA